MKVCIVTEGGGKRGFGHITRCVSLYQAFNEIEIIPQFIVNGDETVQNMLKDINHETFDWIADERKLLAVLRNADIVFVDSYQAGRDLYNKISNQVKTAVYLDDNMRLDYPKGIILNGAVFAERMPYPVSGDVSYLLGIQYALLRNDFWDVPKRIIRKEAQKVLITFGGIDYTDFTVRIITTLLKRFPDLSYHLVAKSPFNYSCQNLISHSNLSAVEIRDLMLECDLCISGGGQTLYELARCGLASIGICLADNQKANLTGLYEKGIVKYIGDYTEDDILMKIITSVESLLPYDERINRSESASSLVDGNGAGRVCKMLLKCFDLEILNNYKQSIKMWC